MKGPTAGELRRRAARLCQLGYLLSVTADDEVNPTSYTAVTAAGEVSTWTRAELPAYLAGVAQGWHARHVATRPAPRRPVDVACPSCQAKPGRPCTQPTDTGRRPVTWHHDARTNAAAVAS